MIVPQRSHREIEVLGIGCRLPGAIDGPKALWHFLSDRQVASEEVPKSRWNIDKLYGGQFPRRGKICTRRASMLEDVGEFDAEFFGIPEEEATETDPQHRLLLEVAWEAVEDACIPLHVLQKNPTGVFVGISTFDYSVMLSDVGMLRGYSLVGTKHYMAANRISYAFGLSGLSLAIDTACASSLAAMMLACQSISDGECDYAIVGCANLMLLPQSFVSFSQLGTLSPDGRSRPFDKAADGYGRGEGIVAMIIGARRPQVARGARPYAVIRGWGANHGGHNKQGWAAPNVHAQCDLLRRTYERANVSSRALGYLEAHGTGTTVGDHAETAAIGAFLALGEKRREPLLIGSVKGKVQPFPV